jgi:hypothetical protein
MADVYPNREDEERPLDLDPEAAPDQIGVYDRPERAGARGVNVMMLLVIFVLLVVAYFVLVSIL